MRKRRKFSLWSGTVMSGTFALLLACATAAAVPEGSSVPVASSMPGSSTASLGGVAEDAPRLVVFVIIDQLRGDLLDRYSSLFSGGLKRLMEGGLSYSNALHAHAQTETSPGHATISTGVFPNRAGIPSNAWREPDGNELRTVYNVVDPQETLVGIQGLPGASPGVLRRTGLADWVQAADSDAKVVSVSAKDRAAVLMAGKSKGEVYWFDSQVGRFVTSTFYRQRNPFWLDRFHERGMERYAPDSIWVSTVPPDHAHLSAPDTAAFEADGVHSFFPHEFAKEVADPGPGDFNFWFEKTPMLDEATLDVALLALDAEDLGQKEGRTDFLSISFSQTDRVGHEFGPLSREQMDNLLRLDRVMDRLLEVLDEKVGPDNYVLGFTGDHGVMNNPERIKEGGLRLTDDHRAELEQALSVAARESGMRPDLSTPDAMVESMKDLEFVGPTYTHKTLEGLITADTLANLFQHSYTAGRAGGLLSQYGVEMWWAENVLAWGMPMGTTHGSPFSYDRWVPMILMGPGIEAGLDPTPVRPMDLAPTLAALAGIPFPEDLDGRPLLPKGG